MCPTSPAPILSGKDLFLPEALGQVLVGAVAENGDDHTILQLPCDAQGGRDRGPRGDTHQDALLAGEALDHLVGLFGRGAEVPVGDGGIVDLRHYGARHVLHALEAVERRVGLEGDDLNFRVVLLEARARPDEGAARAETSDEVRDLTFGLLPDLGRRGLVVRARVGRVLVLVGVEVPLGVLGVQAPRLPDGAVGALAGVGEHDLYTVGAQYLLALLAGVLGHAQLDLVTQGRPDPGVGDPRVTARGVEDGLPGHKRPALLAVPDHPQGGPVFYRTTRVVPLGLAQDRHPRHLARDAGKLQKRRISYEIRGTRPYSGINPSNHVGIIIQDQTRPSRR